MSLRTSSAAVPIILAGLLGLLLLSPTGAAQAGSQAVATAAKAAAHAPLEPAGTTAAYIGQDLRREGWTSLGVVPVRPMAITPDDARLYAVNTHDSTVACIDFQAKSVLASWRVPWGPVSTAIYDEHPDGVPRLLVVSQGNHALTVLERFSGAYIEVLELPFEPADLLVDSASGTAWISCSGAGVVVEIDLETLEQRKHEIPAKHPVYLAFDADGSILAAPQISGNNSKAVGAQGASAILDLEDPAISPTGLPDEDLFRIDPANGAVSAVALQVGTDLFALGLNPLSGKLWQLNIEALNKDPALQSEPAVKGRFAENRLTITQLPSPGSPPVGKASHVFIDLDDADPLAAGAQCDPARTVGSPTGLAFSSAGYCLITGATTDNVTVLAPTGAQGEGSFVLEFDLPPGSIPRQALFDPAMEELILVYCWGTNRVETYTALGVHLPASSFDLGFDPTPPLVRAGRAVFHDAATSLNNNLTCGSCHIEGKSDHLAWNLSNLPFDTKGPLVTQTFKGIDRLAPYHWRGERPRLEDFNVAFRDLLGGALLDESPGGELAQFKAYVFSLHETANPGQDERNLLNDGLSTVEGNGLFGSAVSGQKRFRQVNPQVPGVGQQGGAGRRCVECHNDPMASSGDLIPDSPSAIPQRTFIEVAAFNELWRKEQPVVSLLIEGVLTESALLGSGFEHDGTLPDLFTFMEQFSIQEQTRADITVFVRQFPGGIAPAAHKAILLDQQHLAGEARIDEFFIDQAERGFIDLVAFGTYPGAGGAPGELAWLYDKAIDRFRADDGALGPLHLNAFVKQAALGQASVLFHGLPLGNGQRAALDRDEDELLNQDEVALGTDPLDPDTDLDGFPDGHEVHNGGDPTDPAVVSNDVTPPAISKLMLRWVTAKNAAVTFETSEPASYRIDYGTPAGSGVQSVLGTEPARVHSALLTDLLPSTAGLGVIPGTEVFQDYSATLTVTDHVGLTATAALPVFQSEPFAIAVGFPLPAVIDELEIASFSKNAGNLLVSGSLGMALKHGGPPAVPAGNMVAAFHVVVNGAVWSNITTLLPQAFSQFGAPYQALPGPFVLTNPTSSVTGQTTWSVAVHGLAPGDEVVLNPVLVEYIDPATYDPQNPNFVKPQANPNNYAFADTPAAKRSVTLIY